MTNVDFVAKTNNAWYFGNVSNDMFHGYGLLIYEEIKVISNDRDKTGNSRVYKDKNFKVGENKNEVVGLRRFY
jgi:hypothetical protein